MLDDSFEATIIQHKLFTKKDRLLIAFSGGVDSVVLAHLLQKYNYRITLAHMNFQLRGKDSDADEAFVVDWAQSTGIKAHTKKVDINLKESAKQGSLQMQARKLRYDWFADLLKNFQYDYLLTAHHLDDSIETVFNNLLRGSGIRGLSGMEFKTDIRVSPLLAFEKDSILNYAKQYKLEWREDVTNKSIKYQRNFIRHEIIPRLQVITPSFYPVMKENLELLKFNRRIFESKIAEIKNTYTTEKENKLFIDKSIAKEDDGLYFIYEFTKEYGFSYPQLQAFNFKQTGAQLEGKYSWVLLNDREQFILYQKDESLRISSDDKNQQIIKNLPVKLQLGEKQVMIEECLPSEVNYQEASTEYMDLQKISFPLTIRIWQQGDKFIPLGMKGQQKISDILINLKTPIFEKKNQLVLVDQKGIVLLLNKRIAERVKIQKDTESVIRIKYYGFV